MNFAQALADATANALCSVIDDFRRFTEMHRRIFGRIDPLPNQVPYWRALNRRLCDKPEPGGDPPPIGGQCPCVKYEIRATVRRYTLIFPDNVCGENTNAEITREVWGEVENVYIQRVGTTGNTWGVRAVCRGLTVNDPEGVGCKPSGVDRQLGTFNSSALGTDGACPEPELLNVEVVRSDGQPPEECDLLPLPPLPPPDGWNNVIINNFTWIDNSGNTVIENLGLTFGFAYFNDSFDLDIPVKVDIGGINFNGTFNFDRGAFNFDFSRNFAGDGGDLIIRLPGSGDITLPSPVDGSPDRGEEIEPDPNVDEDDDSGEDEEGGVSRIVAARVVVTAVNNKAIGTFFQQRNPDIAIPNYGYISFFIPTSGSEGGWTHDIPIKNANNFIPCPWEDGATAVRGTARDGVSWSIQALRKTVSTKVIYPA